VRRPWTTWAVFGLCLAVLLLALGWMTRITLSLDRARTEARRQAATEERIRLALWRMDSGLATLISRESARPYFDYSSFHPAERAYTNMFAPLRPGEVLIPSLLLAQNPSHVLLHFQLHPDGSVSSPRVPTGDMRNLAASRFATREQMAADAALLAQLRQQVNRDALSALPEITEVDAELLARISPPREVTELKNQEALLQQERNAAEWEMRAQISQQAAGQNILNRAGPIERLPETAPTEPPPGSSSGPPLSNVPAAQPLSPPRDAGTVLEGLMTPIWVGDLLLLARRVTVNGDEYIQGCWLDWPSIKAWLLPAVRDLFPDADLEPVGPPPPDDQGHLLASLPARFVPGRALPLAEAGASPERVSLIIAWGCAILAGLAAALLLRGTLSLGGRRAAFTSAVTHELRTPLTTFRMYAEMLSSGMITDEEKRREYFHTLTTEAERLGHLVENVLAYARLEKGGSEERNETILIQSIIARIGDRLRGRAEQAGMSLAIEAPPEVLSAPVSADVSAVEQILFNLVDNACKYAACAADKRIHVQVGAAGRHVQVRVRDHGPGIAPADARRLFRPFTKSARDAANSAPGVGLGLALSRRLARRMKGSLMLDQEVRDGACFVLTLEGPSS
jgi:signal transduction histidine kinase